MKPISIVIADDHKILRAGLYSFFEKNNVFTIVGEAGNGLEAIEQVREKRPDILILDIAMPLMRGLEAIKEIKRISPTTRILILSMHNREEYVRTALANGAEGYILKESAAEELLSALEHISKGNVYLSPAVSKTIVDEWLREEDHKRLTSKKRDHLSEREMAVLKLVAEGMTNREIAKLLHISVKTVETHRFRLMEKLSLRNLPDLVKYAIKQGLVEL